MLQILDRLFFAKRPNQLGRFGRWWFGLPLALVWIGVGWAAEAQLPQPSMAQRARACTICHGAQDRPEAAGAALYFPRLAGKPQGYLFAQLQNFRDGRRNYPAMTHLLQHMDDRYLQALAGYFAQLELPRTLPLPANLTPAQMERGRSLVQQGDAARAIPACVACHGPGAAGQGAYMPGLLGLPKDYLSSQLGAWVVGKRRAKAPDCMAEIARRLTPEDVQALAGWLSMQPIPAPGLPASIEPYARLPLRCGALEVVP